MMSNENMSYYEGMFLFPQAMAARLQEAIEHTNDLLNRSGAELIAMQKWGERSLAYPIKSHRRGIFLLTYFKCDRSKLAQLERDCNLSESLLRTLITRSDHLTVEEMEAIDQREDLHVEAKLRAEQTNADAADAASETTVPSADLTPEPQPEATVAVTAPAEAAPVTATENNGDDLKSVEADTDQS